ncbi:KTSC domain-containing protein [Pantoea agglomerans]|uniref:KTSC domain-containing protein n=1 Tax=Enterobacter agglomerans TaxID=549 RepID=UPI001397F309|nr:KTSC domain-containing protein [Pantoea agglomerans]QIA51058.1 KTSC domain-containing protein [Pantoea agglomerans]
MNHTPVSSSNLKSVGYDAPSGILEIAFHNGGIYQYTGVPANIYQGLLSAPSKGQYFHLHIKNVYPFRKIG